MPVGAIDGTSEGTCDGWVDELGKELDLAVGELEGYGVVVGANEGIVDGNVVGDGVVGEYVGIGEAVGG